MSGRALSPIVAVAVVTLLGAEGYPPVGLTETALAADDACNAGAGNGCAVSALQKRLLADRVETDDDEALEELVRSAYNDPSFPVVDDRAASFMQSAQRVTLGEPDWNEYILVAGSTALARARKMMGQEMSWMTPDSPDAKIEPYQRLLAKGCKRVMRGSSMRLLNTTCIASASFPPQLNVDEGIYDLLFQALRKYEHDDDQQYLQQYLWRALSDQCLTELGSRYITDVGGRNNGVLYMAQQLASKPPYYAYCNDKLTLAYEIIMCMQGLLLFDDNGTRTQTVLQAGIVPKLIQVMKTEPDLIATQATACAAMTWIMRRHPDSVALFKAGGALPLIDAAMVRHKDGDPTPFMFGNTLGDVYPIKQCLLPKLHLEGDRAQYEEQWNRRMAGFVNSSYKPWLKLHFPPPGGF